MRAQDDGELLLFLSVDLAGSTAYKQEPIKEPGSKPWLNDFWHFHDEFPNVLLRRYASETDADLAQPWVWKRIGDEIIFIVALNIPEEMQRHLRIFVSAIRHYRAGLLEKGTPLDVKASAWLAGFPVTNTKFQTTVLGADGSLVETVDFLGPNIDVGFRISTRARQDGLSYRLKLLMCGAFSAEMIPRFPSAFILKKARL